MPQNNTQQVVEDDYTGDVDEYNDIHCKIHKFKLK